jgi:hypothetical protein
MEAMDLFERYLAAVRKLLPWRRQDDIIAELRANLESQREDREAELGRPLTEGEMIDWLKELGPPLEMAGRYQPPRYLIGPAIFPIYWWILRLVLFWAAVGYGISIVARLFAETHGSDWVAGQIMQYPLILIMATAWVTAAFAALEFIARHYPEKCPDFVATRQHWSPTSLPEVDKQPPAGCKTRSFATAAAELIVQFVLLVWLLLLPRYPFLLMGPGAVLLDHSPVRPAQVLMVWFWSIVAFNGVQLVWQAINLLTDGWRVRSRAQQLAFKAMGLIPTLILIAAPEQIYLLSNPAEVSRMPAGVDLAKVNHGVFFGVIVVLCITAVQLAVDLWKQRGGSSQSRMPARDNPMRLI